MRSSFSTFLCLLFVSAALPAFAATAEPPRDLKQEANGATLPVGAVVSTGQSVRITATAPATTSGTGTYELEIELRLGADPFQGVATHSGGTLVNKPATDVEWAGLVTNTLPAGTYKWQVRMRTSATDVSAWVAFNSGQAAFTVAPPDLPDIVVDAVQLRTIASTSTELQFDVAATFRNRGAVGTGKFVWKAYLSTDKVLQSSDQLVFTATTPVDVAAGASGTATSETIVLNPRPAEGQYYLLVEADPASDCTTACGDVTESNEANNVGSTANYFVNGVDLVAVSISNGPADSAPGQTVTFNIHFFNRGVDNPAPSQAVPFRIVATRDRTVSTDDQELYRSSFTINGPTEVKIPVTFTLPPGVAGGEVYWALQIDPNAELTNEASRANNTVVSPGTTHVRQADLTVDFADLVDVLSGAPTRVGDMGHPARFRIRALNQGDFAAPPYKVGVILSKDTNLSLLSDSLFADVEVQGLATGADNSALLDVTVTLPSKDKAGNPLPTGDYYLFVLLDSFGALNEVNEANNTIGIQGPFRLRRPAADYGVLRVQVPSSAAAGETIALSRVIKNVGTEDGPRTDYACFASANGDIRPTDFPLSFVESDGTTSTSHPIQLQAGEVDSRTEWVRLPSSLVAAPYYLGCIVDLNDEITELTEENNALASAIVTQVTGQSFRIATAQLPDALVATPYRFGLTSSGAKGPVTWSIVGQPPEDLTLSPDGTLAGNPARVGTSSVRIAANDGRAVTEAALVLRVLPPSTELFISTDTLPPVVNSTQAAYQGALSALGGTRPYQWTIVSGTLPNGILLDAATGVLSGTPRSSLPNGETRMTVQVRDAMGTSVQKQITLKTVPPGALVILTTALPDALASDQYISDVAAGMAGGAPILSKPFEWTVVGGRLPDGLSLSTHTDHTTGLVTGTPTHAGTYAFTLQVRDGENRVDTSDFVVRIFANALRVALAAPAPAVLHPGDSLDLALIANGAGGTKFRLYSGALPPGVTLSAEGRISGTVAADAAEGRWNFTVEAKDAVGGAGLAGFALEVTRPAAAQGCSSTAGGASGVALLVFGLLFAPLRRRALR